jgi:hypothetical protein
MIEKKNQRYLRAKKNHVEMKNIYSLRKELKICPI